MSEHNYMQDRELSWLAFNDRVLSEAMTRPSLCSNA